MSLLDDYLLNPHARATGGFGVGIVLLFLYPFVFGAIGMVLAGYAGAFLGAGATLAAMLLLMHFNAESIRRRLKR